MSLLTDVRFALKKHIENEVVCQILAYETYKKSCLLSGEDPSSERFEEIVCTENALLVYDEKEKKGYLRLREKVFSSHDVSSLKEFLESQEK